MGLKALIIVVLFIFFTLVSMTSGAFLDQILPGSDEVIAHGTCWIGGFLVNPVANVYGTPVPYPQADDIVIGLAITTPLVLYIFRKSSWKRFFAAFLIVFVTVLIAYKLIGMYLLSIAENTYGMQDCLEVISIFGEEIIFYGDYSPIFIYGLVLGAGVFIAGVIKLYKDRQGGG